MNFVAQMGALNSARTSFAGPSLIAVFQILKKLSWVNIHDSFIHSHKNQKLVFKDAFTLVLDLYRTRGWSDRILDILLQSRFLKS